MKLMLDLTTEEAEKLTQVLRDYDDEGPYHSAWRSSEIETLSNKVESAIADHDTTEESVKLIVCASGCMGVYEAVHEYCPYCGMCEKREAVSP